MASSVRRLCLDATLGRYWRIRLFRCNVKQVNSEIYVALLNKTEELSISRAGTGAMCISSIWHLHSRSPPKPKTALIIATGGLLGVIAGVVFALVRRAFFAGVDYPDLVERRFNLPIFGAIVFNAAQARLDRVRLDRPIALPSAKGTANGIKWLGTQPVGDGLGSTLGLSAKAPVAMPLQNATVLPASFAGFTQCRAAFAFNDASVRYID